MILFPISNEESENEQFKNNPECVELLDIYREHYKKVGFDKPWIGYFVSLDGNEIIGGGGFKGAPKDGKIELGYGTFKNYQGKGIASEICAELISLAKQTDPSIKITARTLQDGEASKKVLTKNGFECLGIVLDADDGYVLEWEYKTG